MPVKSRIFKLFITILLLFSCSAEAQVIAGEPFIPGEALVQFNKQVDPKDFASRVNSISALNLVPVKLVSRTFRIWLYQYDPSVPKTKLLNTLYAQKDVARAQLHHYMSERTVVTPNDTYFSNQWDMNNTGQNSGVPDADIDAPEAWSITTGGLTMSGDTIVVAVIDGGFGLNHPDLDFFKNYDEIPNNGIDDDGNGYIDDFKGWNAYNHTGNITTNNHGTHVSGTVGAKGNNNLGVTGVNWNVKVLAIQGSTSQEATAVEAYSYAYDMRKLYDQTGGAKGAFVVSTNASFGVDYGDPADYPIWCSMYDSLGKIGILSAGATANIRLNIDVTGDIPTACPSDYLIAVTNTNNLDSLYSSAGYGKTTIDLGAPGTGIWSTTWQSSASYGPLTGTSMATPHVAGAVALMHAAACSSLVDTYKLYPDSFALIFKQLMMENVDTIPKLKNITVSEGRLNLYKSVSAVHNYDACLTISVNEKGSMPSYRVYPNPVTDMLTIENGSGSSVKVHDTSGRLVYSGEITIDVFSADLSRLAAGMYVVTLSDRESTITSRLVKISN